MISYKQAAQVIKSFADAHWQIKKFGVEFKEQMPNIATLNEKYPILFMCPISSISGINTREFEVDIYCLDRLMQDRENSTTIVSDTELILADLARWLEEGQDELEVAKSYAATPINNDLLDYCSGWVMRLRFDVERIALCEIPMDSVDPTPEAECDPVTYTIYDTDSNVLYSGSVASGGELNQTIQDSTVSNSDDTYTASVLAEGSHELPNIRISNQDDTFDITYPASKEYEIPNTTIKNSNETYQAIIASCVPFEIPDSTILNSDESYSQQVPSPTAFAVPDSQVNVNGVDEGDVVSVKTVDIVVNDGTNPVTPDNVTIVGNTVTVSVPPQVNRTTARIMKTNQTTSYRTGDDGDDERGRATSFLTLAENNIFGNTNRFTDRLGGQTYADNIVIDHSTYQHGSPSGTIIGWYKVVHASATGSWNEHIDRAVALSVGTFTSGWRLPNYMEYTSIWNFGSATTRLNYAPFNDATATNFWTSNTLLSDTTQAFYYLSGSGISSTLAKTGAGSMRSMAVRVFTVTGTTLT